MNAVSSRSHSIFIITIETSEPGMKMPDGTTSEPKVKVSVYVYVYVCECMCVSVCVCV
jgi:hypothetical protein